MSKPNRATQEKRNREREKKEKKQEKIADRAVRKELRRDRETSMQSGVDPDLIGIFPGPQPLAED